MKREREGESGTLGASERQELARLRAQKAAGEKERAELERERDVLKRSVVLWERRCRRQGDLRAVPLRR